MQELPPRDKTTHRVLTQFWPCLKLVDWEEMVPPANIDC